MIKNFNTNEAVYENMVSKKMRTLIENKAESSNNLKEFIEALAIIFNVTDSPVTGIENIPEKGSLVIAANHPFGIKDGIKIAFESLKKREDVKILVRDEFVKFNVKGFDDLFLYINKSGDKERLKAQQEVINKYLLNGGCLIIFGTGLVERKDFSGKFVEQKWKRMPFALARENNANVLPVSVGGELPRIFYILDQLKLSHLALFLLLRLNFKHKGDVPLHFFDLIDSKEINNSYLNKTVSELLLETGNMVREQTKLLNQVIKKGVNLPNDSTEKVSQDVDSVLKINENFMLPETQKEYLETHNILKKENLSLGQTFYLLPPNNNFAQTNFCKQLVIERARAFDICKEATDAEINGETNVIDNDFYQAIIFDESDGIACGYRIKLLENSAIKDMYNADLFNFSSEFEKSFKDVSLELGRSFMNASYSKIENTKKGMMAFSNMFKGLHRTIRYFQESDVPIENLIGSLSFSSLLGDLGPKIIGAYQSDFNAEKMGYSVEAKDKSNLLTTFETSNNLQELIKSVPKEKKWDCRLKCVNGKNK